MARLAALVLALVASCSAFVVPAAPARAVGVAASSSAAALAPTMPRTAEVMMAARAKPKKVTLRASPLPHAPPPFRYAATFVLSVAAIAAARRLLPGCQEAREEGEPLS